MVKNSRFLKEKLVGVSGSLSGITGFLGSYQVCHNVCLSVISILGALGVTVVGMPLLFLTKVAVPFWIAASVLLFLTLVIYFRKRCISNRLILFNSGLIVAGTPFKSLQQFSLLFWFIGGFLAMLSLGLYFKNKLAKVKNK